MQQLRGINHHLLTPRTDPLNPRRKPKGVMDDSRDREKGGGEWEKSLSVWAASSLRGRPRGLYEWTINSLCRFPEWGIETNCLLAIQLRSSVPRDKMRKKKKKRRWLWSRVTHKAVFLKHFLFVLQTQTLWEDPSAPLSEVTIWENRKSAKTELLQNGDLSTTCLVRGKTDHIEADVCLSALDIRGQILDPADLSSRRIACYTSMAFTLETVRHWC